MTASDTPTQKIITMGTFERTIFPPLGCKLLIWIHICMHVHFYSYQQYIYDRHINVLNFSENASYTLVIFISYQSALLIAEGGLTRKININSQHSCAHTQALFELLYRSYGAQESITSLYYG